jgi:hypothetical protein
MTGYQSKKAAALDEDGMYLVHHTQPAQKPVAIECTCKAADMPFARCCKTQLQTQEPIGKFAKFTDGVWREVTNGSAGIPLYTTPPQRPWAGLTHAEKSELWEISRAALPRYATYASLVEAKLKEKNNGT